MANLRIAELDFDAIKNNLKTYLQSQSEFSDYDFEGAGLSVLLDVLAYNTHYNAYLANMLANEMFLDSSVKRSSAVSLAKLMGYTPRSARGAKATVDILVNNPTGSPTSITLPRFTPFTTSTSAGTLNFVNQEELIAFAVSGQYVFSDVVLTEGQLLEFSYTVTNPGPEEKYEIPNVGVDTSTLIVTVQASSTDLTTETYTLTDNIVSLTPTSRVYFLEENAQEKYQIFFGDGVLGNKLTAGNIVRIRYLVVNGTAGNSSALATQNFTTQNLIGGSSDIVITTVENSIGGTDKESIGSIKFNAPLFNASRNRAVTVEDYKALIQANFPEAESVAVWGGEDSDPPNYGKVIISLKPFDGFNITPEKKAVITNQILSDKKVLAIQPEFEDPDYIYVNLTGYIKYNSNATTLTTDAVKSQLITTINNYFSTQLGKFEQSLNYSKFITAVLDSNPAITNALFVQKLQKRYEIVLNVINSFNNLNTIKFRKRLVPGSLESSRFFIVIGNQQNLCKFIDIPDSSPANSSGTGTLRIIDPNTNAIVVPTAGTINYATGDVSLNNFIPVALPSGVDDLRVTVGLQETEYDIDVLRNQILLLDNSTANSLAGREAGLTLNVTPIVQ